MRLTPETRTDLVYLRVPIGSFVLKTPFKAQGEPTDPKIHRVGGGTYNLEGIKLVSVKGNPLHTYKSVKYKGGVEKGYGSIMTNTLQDSKKPLIKTFIFERVDFVC